MGDNPAGTAMASADSERSPSTAPTSETQPVETVAAEPTQALTAPPNGTSARKIAANRRNAQKSTGPKTLTGKTRSSWNSTKHGLLSKTLPIVHGQHRRQFTRLLAGLQQDLEPVGALEEVLVEKIALEYWRLGISTFYEAAEFAQSRPFSHTAIDRIVRYQTTSNRQLYQAINQLERLQRLRKGDAVPAPVHVNVFSDTLPPPEDDTPAC